jgi:hypothetical protein
MSAIIQETIDSSGEDSFVPKDATRIALLPHEHSLFCERKQRVCGSVGQLQELEFLEVCVLL